MQCNIDAKGKALRLGSGILVVLVGLLMIFFWARGHGHAWKWLASGLVVAAGLFQIYEGWAGWCVVRAMGIKTRI
jgi:uncharacterized BrkB/YihY/UPF0761 family membrane protein